MTTMTLEEHKQQQILQDKMFEECDFTKRESIIALFPRYKREQLASRKALPKGVNIPMFTMKTPFKDKTLLSATELILEPNRRQALFGPNSCGKTLLFTYMLNGEIEGFPTHLHIHHCKELEEHELDDTALNTVIKSNPYLNLLLKCEAKIKSLMTTCLPTQTAALKENLDFISVCIIGINGYNALDTAVKMLRVLGFDEVGQNRLVRSLSGGLRMRIALCMAFFINADFLLLDEPTNHLDFPSVLWLENRLRGYKGSFLLVSHDRELLKNVCTGVLMFDEQQLKQYNLGFIEFEKKVAAEHKLKYDEILKFCKKHENANTATPIGRQRLDKKQWSDAYHAKLVALQSKFTFPPPVALKDLEGNPVSAENQKDVTLIKLENLTFSYDVKTGHFIFASPIDFHVKAGSRVGVMGPNGAGKSTLLKLLTYKLKATTGTITHHPDFKIAYFGQHSTAELDLDTTPINYMQDAFPKYNVGQLRQHLGKTGIVGNIADTRIRGLSYSQRSCIIFAKLTLESPHLLILDEPTNFLDLESVDSLISACNKYQGALLLVSHNRDFLKKCAKQYLSVVPGQFILFDDLKTAEKATYSFIQEMESGGKVTAKSLIMENPGGGSIHSTQKVGDAKDAKATETSAKPDEKKTETAAPVAAAAKTAPAKTTAEPVKEESATSLGGFALNEPIQAKFTEDGRWYKATVKEIKGDKLKVLYIDYGNCEWLPVSDLRKIQTNNNNNNKQQQNNNNKQQNNNRQNNNNKNTNKNPVQRQQQ